MAEFDKILTCWRKEIDWIEEGDGKLWGYEMSWKKAKKRIPPLWKKTYPEAEVTIIHKDNFIDFVVG